MGTRTKNIIIALVLIICIAGLYAVSRYNYAFFHSVVDLITVLIAAGVFVIVWNERRVLDNHYYLFVGIAFLFFAILDLMHLLGNRGMGVFPEYGSLGPTFYIAARYVLGISLLIAPIFIKRKLNLPITFGTYVLVTTLILLSVMVWRNFPVTYIEGMGLTPFKIISDYFICGILLIATGLMWLNRGMFDAAVFRNIIFAMLLFTATGIAFTLYTDPFGLTNAIGHFIQIGSFYLIYKAFIETALTKPQNILYHNLTRSKEEVLKLNSELEKVNRQLKQDIANREKAEQALRESEEEYHLLFSANPNPMFVFDEETLRFLAVNNAAVTHYGWTQEEFLNMTILDIRLPEERSKALESIKQNQGLLESRIGEIRHLRKDGKLMDMENTSSSVRFEGHPGRLCMINDVTERNKVEAALQRYTKELEKYRNHLEEIVNERTQELHSLSQRLINIQEDERRSISRELHDEIGQSLTVLNMLIGRTIRAPQETKTDLTEAQQMVKEVISQVRNLSSSLHPGMLEDLGLEPTLNWYFNEFGKKTGIQVRFEQSGIRQKFPAYINITIYRIIQEALTNITRYAEVKEADVDIKQKNQRILIRIEDKGKGFETTSHFEGMGLRGMKERVNSINGSLIITSTPGVGTKIEVQIPLDETAFSKEKPQ